MLQGIGDATITAAPCLTNAPTGVPGVGLCAAGSPPPPMPPPPAVLPGSPGSSSVALMGGTLAVLGTGVTVGYMGTVRQSSGSSTTMDEMAAVRALPARDASIDGTLVFESLGVTLQVPVSAYKVHRALAWTYNTTMRVYTAPVAISGDVAVARQQAVAADEFTIVDTLPCVMDGTLVLVSTGFPGPGLNGTYAVSQGTVSLRPDPWSHWQLSSTSPAARRLLRLGADTASSCQTNSGQQVVARPGRVCSAAAGDAGDTVDQPAPAGHQGLNRQGCQGARGSQGTTGNSQNGYSRALQSDPRTTAEPQTVQGQLTVVEPGTTYPHPAADAARGDNAIWLDTHGQVQIFGADKVPKGQRPGLVKGGWRWVVPVWVWLAGGAGLLMLLILGVGAWLLIVLWNKRKQGVPDPHITAHVEAPQQPDQTWATKSPGRAAPKLPNHSDWWEGGRVTTPPASRGAPASQHPSRSPQSEHNPVSIPSARTSKRRPQQHVQNEGQLTLQAWGEVPPALPGAYA